VALESVPQEEQARVWAPERNVNVSMMSLGLGRLGGNSWQSEGRGAGLAVEDAERSSAMRPKRCQPEVEEELLWSVRRRSAVEGRR